VALHYLERHAGSEARLRRVLRGRIRRSFEAHGAPDPEAGEQTLDELVAKLKRLGYVDDARLARSRVKVLRGRGKSARAIRAALAAQGVDREVVDAAIDAEGGDELEAARTYARRRRLGRTERDLAKMARAGFSYDVARRALEDR